MATPDSTLTIIVGGKRFGGWLSVKVGRGVERACGDFDISCTQRWPGQDARFDISEGQPAQVFIGADKVLTGYVEKNKVKRGANEASCSISGRSKTCDLVDCSPDFETVEFAGQDIGQVAQRIAQPFGVDVVAKASGAAFPVAAAHHGETCWKLIERLARQRQLLIMDDPDGRLVLTQLGDEMADDQLVHPSDGLISIETSRDSSKRFSEYRTKAQAGARWSSVGSDAGEGTAEALAHVQGSTFRDPGVTRYRPKTILAEGAAKKEGADKRAEWECRRNIGNALKINVTRVGWRQYKSGKLWRPNMLVAVMIPDANVSARLAISEVTYRKNDSDGELVDLHLVPPEALTPEPPQMAAAGGGGQRWGEVLKGE